MEAEALLHARQATLGAGRRARAAEAPLSSQHERLWAERLEGTQANAVNRQCHLCSRSYRNAALRKKPDRPVATNCKCLGHVYPRRSAQLSSAQLSSAQQPLCWPPPPVIARGVARSPSVP
eukprot:scaffold33259_cov62-Phaeocystis_antarctica.AAC.1